MRKSEPGTWYRVTRQPAPFLTALHAPISQLYPGRFLYMQLVSMGQPFTTCARTHVGAAIGSVRPVERESDFLYEKPQSKAKVNIWMDWRIPDNVGFRLLDLFLRL